MVARVRVLVEFLLQQIFLLVFLLKLHILFLSGWYPSRVSPSNGDFVQRHAEAVATVQNITLIHVITDKNIKRKECSTTLINNVLTKIIYIPRTSNPISKFISFFKTYLSEINKIGDFETLKTQKMKTHFVKSSNIMKIFRNQTIFLLFFLRYMVL